MTDLMRVRVPWSGSLVTGPAVSTFYAAPGALTGWRDALVALFTAVKPHVPAGITWEIPSTADILDEGTGKLTGTFAIGAAGTVTSNTVANEVKPGVGCRIRWHTAGVVGGRRVTGTTFIVPIQATLYPNGLVSSSVTTSLNAACAAYIAVAGFTPVVYSPLVNNVPDPKGRNRPGASSEILSGDVASQMTWLRSRRT
jgi:hypothetical protein